MTVHRTETYYMRVWTTRFALRVGLGIGIRKIDRGVESNGETYTQIEATLLPPWQVLHTIEYGK